MYCLAPLANDCFLIGREAYDVEHWARTRGWMLEALKKFDEGGEGSDLDLWEVYDHLAFAEYKVRSGARLTCITSRNNNF